MHYNVKRALAVAAMAPFALTAVAGSAGAVSIRSATADVQKDGSRVTATCEFTPNTYFQVFIDLKGNGMDNDTTGFDDIESIKVEASDRDADGDGAPDPMFPNQWYDTQANAEVKEIRVSYYNFMSSTSPALSKVQTGALVADGDAAFQGRDNTRKVNVQVKWTNVGNDEDSQPSVTGHCSIVLPQSNTFAT